MKGINEEVDRVIKTGKVIIGTTKVIEGIFNGNPKLILLSEKCPKILSDKIKYYSKLGNIPYIVLKKNTREFGAMIGKPFQTAAISIIDEGESSILDL